MNLCLVCTLVEGVCENIAAGDHYVQIRTYECYYGSSQNPAYFHTGWNSGYRMHIEEVRQNQRLDAGELTSTALVDEKVSQNHKVYIWL